LRAGFVECRNDHPSGRGRPRILYTATDAALRLFHVHGPCLVVPALLHTIKGLAGVNSFNGTVSSVGKIVAEHYLSKITARKPEARLQQMADLMNAEGGLIETSRENGRFVVCRRSCPFVGMNDGEFSMCQVDLELMSRVARKSLRRITYRHAGGPCCTFVVANPHDHCG
jgi:predicted ArsR family transcriptional regulator